MNFTIYSREGCPFCERIIKILELGNFKFVEYKLDEDFNRFEFSEEFGGNATFPQVTINGQKMGGCTETVKYLREHIMI